MDEKRVRLFLPPALIIAILSVSTASILIRYAQKDAPSLAIAAIRLTFAGIALAPFALKNHKTELQGLSRRELVLGLLSGLFLAVHFATWISSLEYTTVASSVVFVSTGPLWVALLSPVLLNEKITRSVLLGLPLALLGGFIIGLSDSCSWHNGLVCPSLNTFLRGRSLLGNFLALVGAWAVTGYLMIGRRLRTKISLIPYIFLVYGMAAIGLIILMLAAGQSPFGYHPITYLWLVLLALLPQLIGHSTYNWALRYLPAAYVAVMTLGEPIGSTILAYFLLRETPTLADLLGGILILSGIYFTARGNQLLVD